ncbi:uncharacterized protein LOC123528306 isoform X2 [Mercenaria mercenaria]|uniref:uncharacterized protein LOC123528306 isoform X2 n=1 Tax=Mercenaria mercenaria TaxID=6596 RepID=UPI00234EDB90|nr:uncharacterized protein LOC123528306 isoform X2 [Mercenaria mercenaria]
MAWNATDSALNIDASGLLKVGYNHAGTLYIQKNSKRKTKWIPRFVIIARGWIYIFQDKNAKIAEKTFPLHDFNRVESYHHVAGENFCFCLNYSDLQKKEPLIFACEVEKTKQTWMKHFDEAIKAINGSSADSDYESITGEGNQPAIVEVDGSGYLRAKQMKSSNKDFCQDEQKWKRKSVRTEPMSVQEKCDKFVSAVDRGYAENDIDVQYKTVYNRNQVTGYSGGKDMRAPPLPAKYLSQTSSQAPLSRNNTEPILPYTEQDREPSVTKSHSYVDVVSDNMSEVTSCASSSRKSKGLSSATFMCEFRAEAERMLNEQPVGNFLVCPSEESTWVLLVKTNEEVSKILIHTNGENSTVSFGTNTPVFRSLCELIKFYQLNKLPLEDADMILKESGQDYSKQRTVISYRL